MPVRYAHRPRAGCATGSERQHARRTCRSAISGSAVWGCGAAGPGRPAPQGASGQAAAPRRPPGRAAWAPTGTHCQRLRVCQRQWARAGTAGGLRVRLLPRRGPAHEGAARGSLCPGPGNCTGRVLRISGADNACLLNCQCFACDTELSATQLRRVVCPLMRVEKHMAMEDNGSYGTTVEEFLHWQRESSTFERLGLTAANVTR